MYNNNETKNIDAHKMFFDGRKYFLGSTFLDTMKVLYASKQVNGCQKDGFSSVGAQMGALKFTMADT